MPEPTTGLNVDWSRHPLKDSVFCYPKSRDGERRTFKAEPHQTICHCGQRIEQDERGTWFHV